MAQFPHTTMQPYGPLLALRFCSENYDILIAPCFCTNLARSALGTIFRQIKCQLQLGSYLLLPSVRNRSAHVLAGLDSMVFTQGNHVNVTWSTDLPGDANLAENLRN
jgi:hypothetical protein